MQNQNAPQQQKPEQPQNPNPAPSQPSQAAGILPPSASGAAQAAKAAAEKILRKQPPSGPIDLKPAPNDTLPKVTVPGEGQKAPIGTVEEPTPNFENMTTLQKVGYFGMKILGAAVDAFAKGEGFWIITTTPQQSKPCPGCPPSST